MNCENKIMGAEYSDKSGSYWLELTAEEVGEAVADLDPAYETYKEKLISHNVDGRFLADVDLDESEIRTVFENIGIENIAHQFQLRDILSMILHANNSRTTSSAQLYVEASFGNIYQKASSLFSMKKITQFGKSRKEISEAEVDFGQELVQISNALIDFEFPGNFVHAVLTSLFIRFKLMQCYNVKYF